MKILSTLFFDPPLYNLYKLIKKWSNKTPKNKSIIIFDKIANINVKAYITSITRENDKVLINIYTTTAKNISLKKESLSHASNYIKNKLKKYSVVEK